MVSDAAPEDARTPWDRRPRESAAAHVAFRAFRDLGPLRTLDALVTDELPRTRLSSWSVKHDWRDRAAAWDDELHRTQDQVRLEAIRTMHDVHQRAGRAILSKALRALDAVSIEEIPPYVAGRLLELGARLERDTLTVSVEQLQGVEPIADEDPWELVARELDAVPEA